MRRGKLSHICNANIGKFDANFVKTFLVWRQFGMSAVALAIDPLDRASLEAIMIRWKLAENYLLDEPDAPEAGKMALHVLVSHDFPMLVKELSRLRPELSLTGRADTDE